MVASVADRRCVKDVALFSGYVETNISDPVACSPGNLHCFLVKQQAALAKKQLVFIAKAIVREKRT